MTEKVHAHGALAGVELCLGGARMANLETREVSMSAVSMPNLAGNPFQTRAMDIADIREVRRWHRNAALRAKEAGFDLVYVYATHGYMLSQFLSPRMNTRIDEYGGSLENRVRLVREIIEDTKEAVGDAIAVAVRFSAETNGEGVGGDGIPVPGETEDMFGILGEMPDLWDINVNDYSLEMGPSRFVGEGALEPYIKAIKSLTSKPVVSVGRFTSPDTMASQLKRGVVDLIGAARPSIADPFLPKKIEEGRLEDIRECIGCNICYMGDGKGTPIRCTQNPTMSEEWRRGWHPEKIQKKKSDNTVLVIGTGPAGLEAAHCLGKRGYRVLLAEASCELGGRVTKEARLPGLSEWIRVRDYRVQQIEQMSHVEIFRESRMGAKQALEVGADHIAVATGASWRRDGYGANALGNLPTLNRDARVYTPGDIMAGATLDGPVIIYDDDHYYMASVIAELVRASGVPVKLITPGDTISSWGSYTCDRWRAQTRLMKIGVELVVSQSLSRFDGSQATFKSTYTGTEKTHDCSSLVLVTSRQPDDGLYFELDALQQNDATQKLKSLKRIGDCEAPAIIAAAVYSGHRYARHLEETIDADNPLKHDRVFFNDV